MDRICIKDLEIYCHHGVLEEETALGQKFLVSIQLYTDMKSFSFCKLCGHLAFCRAQNERKGL